MSRYDDFIKRWVFRNEVGNQIVQDLDALIQEKVEENKDFWEDSIGDVARGIDIDIRGIAGLAIVHALADTISDLRKELDTCKEQLENQ